MRTLAVAIALCGCSASAPPPAATAGSARVDHSAAMPTTHEDISFDDGVTGTIVHPVAPGKYPAVVFMAGSGPTDRDWNSPLIVGKNAAGRQLAEAIAAHGVVVLRFDKAGTGGNKHAITGGVTFDIYRDEGRAALAELRKRADVDPAHLFVLGHSEGAFHAERVALAEGHAIAGVLLISGSGRTLAAIIIAQIDAQMRAAAPAQADATRAALEQAFADVVAGKTVDPAAVTPIPGIQAVVRSVADPKAAALIRGLLAFDPVPAVAAIDVPVFVFGGGKDVQVDPDIDAKALAGARTAANKDVTLFVAPDANHILEHEPRAKSEITPTTVNYNTDDRVVDPASLDAIVGWIAKH